MLINVSRIFLFLFSTLFFLGAISYAPKTNLLNDSFIEKYKTENFAKLKRNGKALNSELQKIRKSIECLALNIYYEARGEPFIGQIAVARVVMNRVHSGLFPNTPCKVIYQAHEIEVVDKEAGEIVTKRVCQFSWVCDDTKNPDKVKSTQDYKKAHEIAERIIIKNEWADIFSTSVLYFHNLHVNPKWNLEHVTTIGNHKFFTSDKKE